MRFSIIKENKAGRQLWYMERSRTVHSTIQVDLDREIDDKIMKKAFEKAIEAYPPLRYSVEVDDEKCYFTDNTNPLVILNQEQVVSPGSKRINYHEVSVNYLGNSLFVSIEHSLTDGGGMLDFAKSLLYFYFCLLDDTEYSCEGIRTQATDGMEIDFWTRSYSTEKDYHLDKYMLSGDVLTEALQSNPEHLNYRKIAVPSDRFMEFVKENESSPAAVMTYLMALAIKQANEKGLHNITSLVTVSAKKALEMENTFMNCSLAAYLNVKDEDCDRKQRKDILKRLRHDLKEQTTADAIRQTANTSIEKGELPSVMPSFLVSYLGRFLVSEFEKHIREVNLFEESYPKINGCDVNGKFYFYLIFGSVTEKYADAFEGILHECEIPVLDNKNVFIKPEYKD